MYNIKKQSKKQGENINNDDEKLLLSDVMKSVCEHKNQERIDWGTNKCKDCGKFINTCKQTAS